MRFDLVIVGETPDAWAAAEDAALLGRRTLVLRPETTTREKSVSLAAILTAFDDESSASFQPTDSLVELGREVAHRYEKSVERLLRLETLFFEHRRVRFLEPGVIETCVRGETSRTFAETVLIAVGTTARRPRGLAFDGRSLFIPEDIPHLTDAPGSLIVLGGNRTARACARLFAAVGTIVRVIDDPTSDTTVTHQHPIKGEVLDIRRDASGVRVRLTDGRVYISDAVLFAADRVGATASLSLWAAGLETDEDGRLWCDDNGQTWVPTIYAAGEVVGYPRRLRDDTRAARRMTSFRERRSLAAASVERVG